jgi:hypothetical protein
MPAAPWAAPLRAWSLVPIIFIVSPRTAFIRTHDPTRLSHDAAPAVLVPERFRMNHALPLRWMRSLAHLSSVGWTVLQYFGPERSWEFAPSVESSDRCGRKSRSPAEPCFLNP